MRRYTIRYSICLYVRVLLCILAVFIGLYNVYIDDIYNIST